MKTSVLLFIGFILFACSNNMNEEKEKAEIKSLLEKETHYAANADIENWTACWVNTDEASFIETDINGSRHYYGFENIMDALGQNAQPFNLKLTRDNYHFVIGKDMAFVSYDQTDNWEAALK